MATRFLQVGAVEGQTIKIELFDARSHKLGINDLQIDAYTEAQKAIIKIDEAIRLASSHRSKFGA